MENLVRILEGQPEVETTKAPPKGKKKADGPPVRFVSFHATPDVIYEQVADAAGRCAFLAYDVRTGKAETVQEIPADAEIIQPINGDDIELGAVKLPSAVQPYTSTLSLLTEIEDHIKKYLDVSATFLKFAAYYVALSWLYDRFSTVPYLRALGDTGCGKSRFLDVIGGIAYKPISASGCVTPAPIYRMLRRWGGTLILDEADMKSSDEYNEVITILNCGFERGRPVLRATKDNPDKIQVLPVYGPKIFATRRRFQDVALEARCLTEIMQETDRDDIPPVLGRQFRDEQQSLRNKLLLFRFRNYHTVDPEAGADFRLPEVEPRLRQVSEAFLSLFANEPAVIEDFKSFIADHQRELIEQRANTKTGLIVNTLFALLGESGYTSTQGTQVLWDSSQLVPHEVIGISPGDIAERLEMTPQSVGVILKGLGLCTKVKKRHGERKREIVYNENAFKKLQKRYVIDEPDDQEIEDVKSNVPREPCAPRVPLFNQGTPSDITKTWPFCEGCNRKVPSVNQNGHCPDCEAVEGG